MGRPRKHVPGRLAEVGERVRTLREGLRLSQTVFAENVGLRQSHLAKIENGHRQPPAEFLLAVQRVFGVPPEEILYGTAVDEPEPGRWPEILARLRSEVEQHQRITPDSVERFIEAQLKGNGGEVVDELSVRREKRFGDLPAEDAKPDQLPSFRIAAGRGVEPLQLYTYVDNPAPTRFSPKKYFVLQIKGDSMSGDDLHDGDLVIVRRSETQPLPHQIAVVENEDLQLATLKRVRQEGAELELISSNPEHPPFRWDAAPSKIRGIFVQKMTSP